MSEFWYCGFPAEMLIVPHGVALNDIKLYAVNESGKRFELVANLVNGQWLVQLTAEQTESMGAGDFRVQADYVEDGIASRQPSTIATFSMRDRL